MFLLDDSILSVPMKPQPAIQAAVAKAKAIEKGKLVNPPGRPPGIADVLTKGVKDPEPRPSWLPKDWSGYKRQFPKGAYRKRKTTDSTIAIRLAMKQAV